MSAEQYELAVETAKEHILAGDIFQVVLSQRFDFELDAEPFDVYRVLRQINPSPYMYFVRQPEVTLVGCSPEPMVQLLDGRVISRPIAGTRRRGRTEEEDRRLGAELKEHPKEIAEHVMLVDLARNDVGSGRGVRQPQPRRDDDARALQPRDAPDLAGVGRPCRRSGPRSMCSEPRCRPAPCPVLPRCRAMEIIDALEPVKRGPYAGIVGYLDFSGNIDTAIAIRTMVITPDGASVQAGAGIVADSVPAHENLECHNKARALLAAVRPAERMTASQTSGDGHMTDVIPEIYRTGAAATVVQTRCDPRRRSRHRDLPPGSAQPGSWPRSGKDRVRPGHSCCSLRARSTRGSG